ncbi:MAG: thioredoxin [Lachnospiraceae bacterium]|nr:thioredoxin [Lachnospiraceae bacterium]
MAKEFTDQNFEEEVLKSELPVLVDFYADWCGPCKMMAPVIENLAVEYAGRINVGKLNVDTSQASAVRYRVMSIPTMILFVNGEVKETVVGAVSAKEMVQKLDKVMNG